MMHSAVQRYITTNMNVADESEMAHLLLVTAMNSLAEESVTGF